MTKSEILKLLVSNHEGFFQLMQKLPDGVFRSSYENKWSPHQNLEHIRKSVQPLALAYNLPKFIIRLIVGKSNRPSKTYDELVKKYTEKLNAGGRASGRFVPSENISLSREVLLKKIQKHLLSISNAVEKKWTEEELDKYIFPHPLLGKLTAREMLYFTAYHVQHHKAIVEKYYCL